MPSRILYVYAEPQKDSPGQSYNMTALVVDGRTVDTSVGSGANRIAQEVEMHIGLSEIRLNQHPEGTQLNARLDSDLTQRLNEIIGVR
ncbi:hypothetical protein HY212_06210 [Candidatus Pacearchaeota archaeon]|nr:hypothetical protein [Candidatus Pacearchaeota archaeon]